MLQHLIGPISSIIDKIIPDPAQRDKAKLELLSMEQDGELKRIEASMKVVMSEAQGESWLQRNWRPVTMLTFVGLIVAKWLGFTAPGVTDEIELALLDIVKVGLGGYVLGRSAEKVMKEYRK